MTVSNGARVVIATVCFRICGVTETCLLDEEVLSQTCVRQEGARVGLLGLMTCGSPFRSLRHLLVLLIQLVQFGPVRSATLCVVNACWTIPMQHRFCTKSIMCIL